MSRHTPSKLHTRTKYIQVALNGTMAEATATISALPISPRIILEAGTPFIKRYGAEGIRTLRDQYASKIAIANFGAKASEALRPFFGGSAHSTPARIRGAIETVPYIVADMKTIDRGATEVEIVANAGASAIVAMGTAPAETLNAFIFACKQYNIDAMIDMMNVPFPLTVLRSLKVPPPVVILHRGVDEERDNREKMLPFHEIQRIKGNYDIMIAVAGGDTPREVERATFNGADIVVVWKSVADGNGTMLEMVNRFLKEVR